MRILVTGATGFVGRGLVTRLEAMSDVTLRKVVRSASNVGDRDGRVVLVNDQRSDLAWAQAARDVDVVVHLAARVHVMDDRSEDPLAEFRSANVLPTLALARQAADSGVRRFIFISSIKVNGEETRPGSPFRSTDAPAPIDPYGVSKAEAEEGLHQIARMTGMEVVIIRPPLVYGPGVKANFRSLIRLVRLGVPLPLRAVQNKRSFVALDNLVDLIVRCIDHPRAANQILLVSDGDDLSTPELLRRIGDAMSKRVYLFRFPVGLLSAAGRVVGKQDLVSRVCGCLQVDLQGTTELLDWRPPVPVDMALRRAIIS